VLACLPFGGAHGAAAPITAAGSKDSNTKPTIQLNLLLFSQFHSTSLIEMEKREEAGPRKQTIQFLSFFSHSQREKIERNGVCCSLFGRQRPVIHSQIEILFISFNLFFHSLLS